MYDDTIIVTHENCIREHPYLSICTTPDFCNFFYKLVNLVSFSLQLSLHRKVVFIPTGRQKYVLTQRQVFSCFQIFASITSFSQGLLNSYQVGSKKCYLLSFKELFLSGITQPPETSLNTFFYLCVCFFLYVSMQ